MKKVSILIIVCLLMGLFSMNVFAKTPTLKMWFYFAEGSNAIRWAIDQWNQSHDEFKVEYRYIPFADLKRELTKAITTGTTPDMVILDNPDHAKFAAMGAFADITDKVKEWGMADKYFDGPWKSTMYKGKNYGVPQNSNTIALFYNKDLIKKAGLEGPPETWADLRLYAKKLTDKANKVRGISFSAVKSEEGTFQFLPFIQMAGADIYSLDSKEAVDALQLWTDLYKNGWATPEVINFTQSEAMGVFASGNSAMCITGPWDLHQLDDVDFNWGITLLPYKKDVGIRSSALGGENFAIMKASPYVDEAWKFIKWTQRRDFVEKLYIKGGRMPSRSDVANESTYWKSDPSMKVFLEQLKYAKPRGPHPKWPEISYEIQMAMQKAMTGQASPEKALQTAAKNIDNILGK